MAAFAINNKTCLSIIRCFNAMLFHTPIKSREHCFDTNFIIVYKTYYDISKVYFKTNWYHFNRVQIDTDMALRYDATMTLYSP